MCKLLIDKNPSLIRIRDGMVILKKKLDGVICLGDILFLQVLDMN